jgi:dTDP-4-amino-4,6-dideoxygalactose transaminase
MDVPLLDLKEQYCQIKSEVREALDQVLESQSFILGAKVARFEGEMAHYLKVKHALGVSSGTDALVIALLTLGIGAGDSVLTTPYTFFATAGSISRAGATPVFADIDPESFTISPERAEETIRSLPPRKRRRLKAVIPVHLFGQCAPMGRILQISEDHDLAVIEDAAQAIGATILCRRRKRRAGSMGHMGCFSFFPSKNLGGFGDGGMVATNEGKLAEKARALRVHGSLTGTEFPAIGINGRLDAIQAAVLSVKLKYLDEWTEMRRTNARTYGKLFEACGLLDKINTPVTREGNVHTYHQYVIRAKDRDALMAFLSQQGVGCRVYYPNPLHLQKCYRQLGYTRGDFPQSEKASRETLALPMYPELTYDQQRYTVKKIAAFYKGRG